MGLGNIISQIHISSGGMIKAAIQDTLVLIFWFVIICIFIWIGSVLYKKIKEK
jgi:hypothetical protein